MTSRRKFIVAGAAAAASATTARAAAAEPSAGEREGRAPRKQEPAITLTLPRLAETGNSVPVAVRVRSPMTDASHVTRIDILAPRNPEPRIASFHFTPICGVAEVRSRIRLAGSQRVTARAEFNDGRRVEASASVVVTLGACVEDLLG